MPVDEISVLEALRTVPSHFTKGLDAVLLLGGTRKQEKAFKRCFVYGRYSTDRIFLHPFPRKHMVLTYRFEGRPSILNEYERAGAKISFERRCWHVQFDEESLKRFYLQDVLMHELGHHVDSPNFRSKSDKKAEGFAEWFASEYGYRLARLRRRDE